MAAPALILAAAQALLPFIADLMRSRGTKTSERNAEILEKAPELVPVIMELGKAVVPDAKNEQDMVEKIAASTILQNQLRAEAALRWSDIRPFLEFEEESRQKSRDFVTTLTAGDGWRSIGAGVLVGILSLTIVVGGGAMFWNLMDSPELDPGQKGLILGALIAAFTTTVGFWFGSSRSSQLKDQAIADQAAKPRP